MGIERKDGNNACKILTPEEHKKQDLSNGFESPNPSQLVDPALTLIFSEAKSYSVVAYRY